MNGGRLKEGYTLSPLQSKSRILKPEVHVVGLQRPGRPAGGLKGPTFGCDGWGTQRKGNRAGDSSK